MLPTVGTDCHVTAPCPDPLNWVVISGIDWFDYILVHHMIPSRWGKTGGVMTGLAIANTLNGSAVHTTAQATR